MTHPIANYRQRHGLTLDQFGAMVGVNRSVVLKWERGALPRGEALARIETATEMGVTAEMLIRWRVKEAA